MIDLEKVGRKIQTLRTKANMSQEDLANKLFMTRQAVSRYENGLSAPTIDSLIELSHLFNVTFDEILCLNESTEIDNNDIFKNHDRVFILNRIVRNEMQVNLPEVFYQFSPSERMLVLKAIKDGRIDCDFTELKPRLTSSELKFLGGY